MRNVSTKALILSTKTKGESNRLATIFTPEDGIFTATLYGGPKSKLRAQVSPMNSGVIYLYKDEVKKAVKINDFDVKNYHLSFRENLFKSFAANLAVEILMKSHCAGNPEEAWVLLNGFLDGMDYFEETEARIGLVRFLWRYIYLLGIQPDTSCCCQCGAVFTKNNFVGKNENLALSYNNIKFSKNFFDYRFNGFVCADCSNSGENNVSEKDTAIGNETLHYLEAIMNLSPREARALKVDESILGEAKNLCFNLIESVINSKLLTLESGDGIL